jgi:hypothetical protein
MSKNLTSSKKGTDINILFLPNGTLVYKQKAPLGAL